MQIVCLIATFRPESEYMVACCCQSCPHWAIGKPAACRLAVTSHQRCADCGQIVCLIATFRPESEYIVACCCQSCRRCCQLLNSLKRCCTYRTVLGCCVALSLTNQTASTKVSLYIDCILFSFLGSAFSALTLCVGRQEEHPVCKHCMIRC